jgi:maltose alpha-D-glucosyltransferase/alpha-amylase
MKANIGIRRRLAPLLENDRNQLELFTALLLSLPGSPVLYYGDEIGMGDNIWLGDRDAVRTPMQWTPDRNAGFSRADPARMYLPVTMDATYGYQAVNVEQQSGSTNTLLHWTRRMIEVRRQHPAFGLGSFTELGTSNSSVLTFLRELAPSSAERRTSDVILCVNNLSRFPQAAQVDLSVFAGRTPVELTGSVPFPRIDDANGSSYMITLPGHGFYWFALQADRGAPDPAPVPEAESGPVGALAPTAGQAGVEL